MRDDLTDQQEKCIFLRQQPEKFRGCSRHGKSLSCLQKSFFVPDIRPFSCCKEKGGSDPWKCQECIQGTPAKLQGSYCAAVKFKGKDRPGEATTGGACRGPGRGGSPVSPAPTAPHPRLLSSSREGKLQRKGGYHAGWWGRKKKNPPDRVRTLGIEGTQHYLGSRQPAGEGPRYLHSPSRLGVGGQELGKKVKENKLFPPLNIHDSSFAKANGKHINPFTTLFKKKDG